MKALDYDAFVTNIQIDALEYYRSTKKKATHLFVPLQKRLKCVRSTIISKFEHKLPVKMPAVFWTEKVVQEQESDRDHPNYNFRRRKRIDYNVLGDNEDLKDEEFKMNHYENSKQKQKD